MNTTLPHGFEVRLNAHVRLHDNGRTLIGGNPTRVLYLTDAARKMLVGRTVRVSNPGTSTLADRLLELGMAEPVPDTLAAPELAEVSVVVPVRDRPAALDRLLASIGQAMPTIVVDDSSTDPGPVAAVAATHGAELVSLATNHGPAGARNAGLRRVSTAYVAFIDSDVVLRLESVSTLLQHFADPRVAMAAPRIHALPEEDDSTWISRYEAARSSLDLGPAASTVRPRAPVAWVPSACVLARTGALDAGFDTRMRVAEDVDLVWRLVKCGWRVRYEPAAHVWHEHRTSFRAWFARKTFYGTGAHQLARRHGPDVAPAVLAPWSTAAVLALLTGGRWALPIAATTSLATVARMSAKLGRSTHPTRTSAILTSHGLVAALSQTMALLLRHWWPLTAVACLFSKQLRRAALLAGIADTIIEIRRTPARLDPIRFGIARRLDDIAYGTGVWAGAINGCSARSLLPDIRRTKHRD